LGILNSAYYTKVDGTVVPATDSSFKNVIYANNEFYRGQFGEDLTQIPSASVKAPSFVPTWLVAYPYPHNVNNQGFKMVACPGNEYCKALPIPVFPTPIYETIIGLALFFFLWSIRKKLKIPGQLFAVYLVVNGLERFFIEKIRVNTKIPHTNMTQAELIAFLLIVGGTIYYFWLRRNQNKKAEA